MVDARIQEDTRNAISKYVDARTGAVSYSGVDMQGVIFLPMSHEELGNYIKERERERQEISEDYQYIVSADTLDIAAVYAAENELNAIDNEISRLYALREQTELYTKPVKLFDLQTVSIQSHREKFPVRTLGRVFPKSYTRGPRTLAGSFIFTLFNKAALWDLLQTSRSFYSSGVGSGGTDSGISEVSEAVLADQLPPFDLTILCSNEYGDSSYMALYGVEIVNDGRTLSIQDMITENVMQFIARDFEDIRPLAEMKRSLKLHERAITAENKVKERLSELQRRGIRLNPFI